MTQKVVFMSFFDETKKDSIFHAGTGNAAKSQFGANYAIVFQEL